MNSKEFDESRDQLNALCKSITDKKGADYTKGSHDVLSHFSESGAAMGMTKYQNLGTFLNKHINAIYNYIKTNGQAESEPIQLRIADAINFLTFFNAMVLEDAENKNNTESEEKTDDISKHKTFANYVKLVDVMHNCDDDIVYPNTIIFNKYKHQIEINTMERIDNEFKVYLSGVELPYDIIEAQKTKPVYLNVGNGNNVEDIHIKPKNLNNVVQFLGLSRISKKPIILLFNDVKNIAKSETHDIAKSLKTALESEYTGYIRTQRDTSMLVSNMLHFSAYNTAYNKEIDYNHTPLFIYIKQSNDIVRIKPIDTDISRHIFKLTCESIVTFMKNKNIDVLQPIYFNINGSNNVTDAKIKPLNTSNTIQILGFDIDKFIDIRIL